MKDQYILRAGDSVLAFAWLTDRVDIDLKWFGESRFTELTKIFVARNHRGKGHGSELMRQICADADKEAILLVLQVSPDHDSPLQEKSLRQFYGRYGFVPTKYDLAMRRDPNVLQV